MEFDYDCLQRHQVRVVRMPSDGVDPSQMHGPCRVYRLGRPMELMEFEQMPQELQRMYLQRLRQRGATADLAAQMLGTDPAVLARYLKLLRVALDRPDLQTWLDFVNRGKGD